MLLRNCVCYSPPLGFHLTSKLCNFDPKGEVRMRRRRILFATLAMLLSATLSHAAAPQSSSSTGVPVEIVVTAVSRHGGDTPVINREDVMVYEGRERDTVTDWVPAQGDRAALDLFLLIDDTTSTSIGSQLDDLRQFITSQPPTTKVGVAYMLDGIAQVLQNPTEDHAQAAKALRLPMGQPGVNTSPYFSLSDLVKRWPKDGARHEVVMVSDGIDRFWGSGPDDPYVDTAVEDAQRAGVIVFSIYNPGMGRHGTSYWRFWWGQIYLSKLSDQTGGQGYYFGFTGAAVSFAPFLDDIAERLRHQYWLTFLAKPQKKAGMQPIKVRTELHHVELVAQDHVYVPASE